MAVETILPTESEINDAKTPEKSSSITPSTSPTTSRYGRTRKPKLSADFVAHDKNFKSFLTSGTDSNIANGQAPETVQQQSISEKLNTPANRLRRTENTHTPKSLENGNTPIVTSETTLKVGNTRGRKKVVNSAGAVVSEMTPSQSLSGSPMVEVNGSAGTPGSSRKRGRPRKHSPPQVSGDMIGANLKTPAGEVAQESVGRSVSVLLEDIGATNIQTPSGSTKPEEATSNVTPYAFTPASASTSLTPSNFVTPGSDLVGNPDKMWAVGDIAWGSIGKFPYWPCIIMTDPVTKTHVSEKSHGRSVFKNYFLQFCGDNGRHSRLPARNLLEFVNRQQFFDLQSKVFQDPRKRAIFAAKFTIKPQSKDCWEQAVVEAEHLISLARDDRIQHFQRLYPLEAPRSKKDLLKLLLTEEDPATNQSYQPMTSSFATDSPIDTQETHSSASRETSPNSPAKKITIMKTSGKYKLKTGKGKNPLKLSLKEKMLPNKKLALLKMKKQLKKQRLQKEQKDKVKRAYRKKKPLGLAAESSESKDSEEQKDQVKRKKKVLMNSNAVEKRKELGSNEESTEVEMDEEIESPTKAKRQKSPIKKRKKRKQDFGPDFDVYCSKNFDRIADEHPELKDEEIDKYLQKVWLEMDDTQKLRYKSRLVKEASSEDEENEEGSESNAEEGDPSDTASTESASRRASPPPIVEAVSKMRKNYSLFRGFKNEKMCMICEKGGETYKCQGFCCGYFHKDCILKGKSDSAPTQQEATSVTPTREDENSEKASDEAKHQNDSAVNQKTEADKAVSDSKCSSNAEGKNPEQSNAVESKLDVAGEKLPADKKEENGKTSTKGKNGDKESVGSDLQCQNCLLKRVPPCFECGLDVQLKTSQEDRIKCRNPWCGRFFHETCLLGWPQAIVTGCTKRKDLMTGQMVDKVLTCPQHVCHTCVSDNPSVIKERALHEKQLVKCIKCPTAYHFGNFCVPAGSEILSNQQMICPRHYNPPRGRNPHINANWCFICSSGGDLICCDLCPATFHAQCVKLTPEEYADGFTCEDCQTGRFPLFGEIVWVKLGHYRWWPAQILFPLEIPEKVMQAPHIRGEFAVRFFGSGDYYWISRGRVFLYHEGDSAGKCFAGKSKMNNEYRKAVEEAAEAHKQWCTAKMQREESRQEMKPPQYVKIKVNKPVGSVKPVELNVSGLTACECDPNKENPCSQDDECLNRMLMVECNPMVCRASERCNNQRFEKRLYPPLEPFRTDKRGWGLRTLVDIKKGDFVIEYVGEIINEQEFKRRVERMKRNNDENFYFLTIDHNRMVDAGPKGNVARFMNHSCDPNCETQKWTVNGDTRVGLFALKDIPQNSELVFNYNLHTGTAEKKACLCGASTCRGFIGAKKVDKISSSEGTALKGSVKAKRRGKENKKVRRKRRMLSVVEDDYCFICDEGGELIVCNNKRCPRAYHLDCIGKKSYPKGQWLCPWHLCDICGKRKVFRCGLCVSSFCKEHKAGNIHLDPERGLCCKKHWDDEEKVAAQDISVDNLSQSIVDEDGAQVLISTPKGEKMSQSIISDDLGTPIPGEVDVDERKTPLKRARCSLNFNTDASSPAKRGRRSVTEKVLTGKSSSRLHVASNLMGKHGQTLPVSNGLLKDKFCFSPIQYLPTVPFDEEFPNKKKRGRPSQKLTPSAKATEIVPIDKNNSLHQSFKENSSLNKVSNVYEFVSPECSPVKVRQRKKRIFTVVKRQTRSFNSTSPRVKAHEGIRVVEKDFDSQPSSSDENASPVRKQNKRIRNESLSVSEINNIIGIPSSAFDSCPKDTIGDEFNSVSGLNTNTVSEGDSNLKNELIVPSEKSSCDSNACQSTTELSHDNGEMVISSNLNNQDSESQIQKTSSEPEAVCLMIKKDIEKSSFQKNFAAYVLKEKIQDLAPNPQMAAILEEWDSDSDSNLSRKSLIVSQSSKIISENNQTSQPPSASFVQNTGSSKELCKDSDHIGKSPPHSETILNHQSPKAPDVQNGKAIGNCSEVCKSSENISFQRKFSVSASDSVAGKLEVSSFQESDLKSATEPNEALEIQPAVNGGTTESDKSLKSIIKKLKEEVETQNLLNVSKPKRSLSDSNLISFPRATKSSKDELSISLCEDEGSFPELSKNHAHSDPKSLSSCAKSTFQFSFIAFLSGMTPSKEEEEAVEIDMPESLAPKCERVTRSRDKPLKRIASLASGAKNIVNSEIKQNGSSAHEDTPRFRLRSRERKSESEEVSKDGNKSSQKRKRRSSLGEFLALPDSKRARR